MKAQITIAKSFDFDDGKDFCKEWKDGDFEQFFKDEGEYLDRLGNTLLEQGAKGEGFTVTYTVTLTK